MDKSNSYKVIPLNLKIRKILYHQNNGPNRSGRGVEAFLLRTESVSSGFDFDPEKLTRK